MPRPFWQGYLKLSLVTCPVAMTPAVSESERVRFHTVNRKTGNRLQSQYVDAETGKPVDEEDQIKGYEKGDNDFVMLDDDEIDSVALESTKSIDVDLFVKAGSIPLIYREKAHYMTPNDEVGEEAFAVIRDAMAAAEVVGISRVVLYRRERAVMLEPDGKGIIAWTLRYGDEVRDPANYLPKATAKIDANLVKMAADLVSERTSDWDKSLVEDPVQRELLKLISSKKPKAVAGASRSTPPSNVVNLFDALRRSLAEDMKGSRKPKGARSRRS